MAFVITDCGTVNSEGLLTINIGNYAYTGWAVLLRYSGRKEDIQLSCKDEAEAKKCLQQINDALK